MECGQHRRSENRAVKSDWQKICRMADRWGITVDTATNSIVPPFPLPADVDEVEGRMQTLEDQIVAPLQRADGADYDQAEAIDGASGRSPSSISTARSRAPPPRRRRTTAGSSGCSAGRRPPSKTGRR